MSAHSKGAVKNYKNYEFVGVKYIRYADNFLIGVSRSKATMLKILERVT